MQKIQVENENLKDLLKLQIEESEKLRVEMQATVEHLREEFYSLVTDIVGDKGDTTQQSLDKDGGFPCSEG